jgi:hypothetical protein
MRCVACGMRINGKPIYEEVDGERQGYCCSGCLEYNICSCGKSLKKINKKLKLKKGMVKNRAEMRTYSFECQY